MTKLVLFDIDHTLVVGTKAHGQAFSYAYKVIYGVEANQDKVFHGWTDIQIIKEVVGQRGIPNEEIEKKIPRCLEVMANEYKKLIANEEIIVLPGVRELLVALTEGQVLIGLVTGNLKDIAQAKLSKVNLWHFFSLGGFGSENEERNKLAKLAIERARKDYKFPITGEVFLVGDAPPDIEAGKSIGAKTIGVATSAYSLEQLKASGADYVLDNLTDANGILKIIGIT
jgi:phosphoglycolate phosphatase-like HAD superfamily hydrolase